MLDVVGKEGTVSNFALRNCLVECTPSVRHGNRPTVAGFQGRFLASGYQIGESQLDECLATDSNASRFTIDRIE